METNDSRDAAAGPQAARPAADWEPWVLAFETAWRRKRRPSLEKFLPSAPGEDRALLHELIAVDLEFRWREARVRGARATGGNWRRTLNGSHNSAPPTSCRRG